MIYKTGLILPNPAHPRLRLSHLANKDFTALQTMPTPPATLDCGRFVRDWVLGGNDRFGSCAPTAYVNADTAWHSELADAPKASELDPLDLYARCTGFDPAQTDTNGFNPTDQGTDPFAMSDWLVKQGYAAAWAEVDHAELVRPAMNCFGGMLLCCALPDNAFSQFDAGCWDYVPGHEPDDNEGHAVYQPAYNPGKVVTWQKVIAMTAAWEARCVRHRIVYFSDDQMTPGGLSEVGLDAAAMARAIAGLRAA